MNWAFADIQVFILRSPANSLAFKNKYSLRLMCKMHKYPAFVRLFIGYNQF